MKYFMDLFVANTEIFGQWNPSDKKMFAVKSKHHEEQFKNHFDGDMGLGLAPVMSDSHCYFGAIDIDAHGDLPDIDILALEAKIRAAELPLVACQSKSGGAHCYVFFEEPVPAVMVQFLLRTWCRILDYPETTEIFPVQTKLEQGQQAGWINMPYFNKNQRVAANEGKLLSYEEFIELAQERRIDPDNIGDEMLKSFKGIPPCLQSMLANGVESGYRNHALYNFTVYLKRAYPGHHRAKARNINELIFEEPLSRREAERTIASASKRDYLYKCKEEPCKSLCNPEECIVREFGIDPDEDFNNGEEHNFSNLKKYITEETQEFVVWELEYDGRLLKINNDVLSDFMALRKEILKQLDIMLPPMKVMEWTNILNDLLQTHTKEFVPETATVAGLIRNRMMEFVQKADLNSDGDNKDDRALINRGVPIVQKMDGIRSVCFRAQDFVSYLKKTRGEDIKGSNLYLALRAAGLKSRRIRLDETDNKTSIWYLPIDEMAPAELGEDSFQSEY